jgi:DNA-damage-inducible protein J
MLQYVRLGDVDSLAILKDMDLVTRTATLQMRVTPAVKYASEKILHRMGMSMTEAMELFLRRVIVDQRIPFEVAALDPETLARITNEASLQKPTASRKGKRVQRSRGGG